MEDYRLARDTPARDRRAAMYQHAVPEKDLALPGAELLPLEAGREIVDVGLVSSRALDIGGAEIRLRVVGEAREERRPVRPRIDGMKLIAAIGRARRPRSRDAIPASLWLKYM